MDADFITLFHFTRAENLSDIITNDRLKLMEAGRSNDPFEMNPTFEPPKDCSYSIERCLLSMKNSWPNIVEERSVPSLCFSANVSSILMWSHYAHAHTGVCLAFRFPVLKLTEHPEHLIVDIGDGKFAQLCPMLYPQKRVKASDYLHEKENKWIDYDYQGLYSRLACSKPVCWAYEKEFRMFLAGDNTRTICNSSMFTSQVLSKLTGVILGTRCRLTRREVETMLASSKRFKQNWHEKDVVRASLHSTRNEIKADNSLIYRDMPDEEYKKYASNRENILTSRDLLGCILIRKQIEQDAEQDE